MEHKNIPDAQLHEPKGVASAGAKRVYLSDGTGSGDWELITEEQMAFSGNVKMWSDVADSLYTSGSPFALTSATRTKLTNNGAAVHSDISRLNVWNTSTNTFNINDLNSVFLLRIGFKAKTASSAGTPYVIKTELQSSNGSLVIAGQDVFLKGGNYENDYAVSIPFYLGSAINNYPLSIYLTADTNTSIYNIGFFLQQVYKES